MVEIFDRADHRRMTAKLENTKHATEFLRINSVNHLAFTLPDSDLKNEHCQPLHYARYANGDLYRIMPQQATITEEGRIRYRCEHVLATLIDSIMYGHHVIGGVGMFTPEVIRWILDKQNKRFDPWTETWITEPDKHIHWQLGRCDFNRQFEYGWSQETLLSALFSVAIPFTEKFQWTFDTHTYPWTINLELLNENAIPEMYIREGKNRVRMTKFSDPTVLATRIFPLGEGEGINQTTIRSVNGNVPFIQSPPQIIEKYGIVERAWIDRRYTDPQSLLNASKAMLHELQQPHEEFETDFAALGEGEAEKAAIGKMVEIVGFRKAFIVGLQIEHEEIPKSILTIANRSRDIASTVAGLADRQRIEMAYAQGATQLFERDFSGNCDNAIPLLTRIMIPASLRIVNHVILNVDVSAFRIPFATTGERHPQFFIGFSGDPIDFPSPAGRPTTATSEPRPFTGGAGHHHDWLHWHRLPSETHTHPLVPAMSLVGNPTSFAILIDGVVRQNVAGRIFNQDITSWLVGADGLIPRNRWFRIEIRPNVPAFVLGTLNTQGFIQSRGNRTV